MSDVESDPFGPLDASGASGGPITAPPTIVCVDCGGTCHLLTTAYEGDDGRIGFRAGDVVAYRCSDCLDRWDVELDDSDT